MKTKMKLCAIQPPYPYSLNEAEATIDFLIAELDKCDGSCDLILLPEYSNAPTAFSKGKCISYAVEHTPRLIEAAVSTARRCNAVVAVNYVAEIGDGYRNTTRVFDRQGNIVGDYYKQHLPNSETAVNEMDDRYTFGYNPPPIIEVDGIRLGFLICYDTYFEEYVAHIAAREPDIVLVSSFQRGERMDMLETLTKWTAFRTNAYVLRASFSMGPDAVVGGTSMAVAPDGMVIGNFGQQLGTFSCEIDDPHWKYMRSNSFGGKQIRNDKFIERGRTPWCYRACGSAVRPNDDQTPYPRICAHRGFNTIAPENSLPAFAAAIALGAQEIELDMWETADGALVVCHDDSIDRTSNGHGLIREMTFAELRKYDFGSYYAAPFAGLEIATLEDVLKTFSRQTIVNLHIKSHSGQLYPAETMRKIVELVYKYDFAEHLYLAGGEEIMPTAQEIAPQLKRCMLVGNDPWDVVNSAIKFDCAKLQFFKPYYNQEMIDRAHGHGIRCNIFWADEVEEAREMLCMGIDTILTNDYLTIARGTIQKHME